MPSNLKRPMPPPDLLESMQDEFINSPDLSDWARLSFIDDDGPLHNPDHQHLRNASIGFLWTNVQNTKQGRWLVGQAERGKPQAMGKLAMARAEMQVRGWFGYIPDFIITIDASYWQTAPDVNACALVDHELYHCAQQKDEFGAPKFNMRTGKPMFGIRGHDVEEFTGVVRRFGIISQDVRDMVEAAQQAPSVAHASIAHSCGTCAK